MDPASGSLLCWWLFYLPSGAQSPAAIPSLRALPRIVKGLKLHHLRLSAG